MKQSMNFSRWMKIHETELRARYQDCRISADYSPDGKCLCFRAYCHELFVRGDL